MFRRLALVLLLLIPGVVVVWAGMRGQEHVAALIITDFDSPAAERRYVFRAGDLLRRISTHLGLDLGAPFVLEPLAEEE